MRVIMFKMDNPSNKYEWWAKDIEVKSLDDLEKLTGCCGNHLYTEVYQVNSDDEPALVEYTKKCLATVTTHSARSAIAYLFSIILKTCKST